MFIGFKRRTIIMGTKFDKISGVDTIFKNPEYISDSIIFNSIESARNEHNYNLYSDHKSVIILTSKTSHKVWIWTSSSIKDDTNKLIDICRFLRDQKIPKAEIYVKQDVSSNLSDLYALTSLDINYVVKDEFSLAVFTYEGEEIKNTEPESDEKIILIDKNNPEHVALVTDFYKSLCEEFRWTDKFDRKVGEYLNMELYGLVKNGKMIANTAIGSRTENYIRIKSVAVLADERQKGYGYKMTVFAVNKIKERGLTPMLYTHIGNRSAMALWKKSGFKQKDKLYLIKVEDAK